MEGEIGSRREAIIGGVDDTAAEWPSVVHVFIPNSSGLFGFCTGTLISPYHVVTAAHCVTDWDPSLGAMSVRLGQDLSDYVPPGPGETSGTHVFHDAGVPVSRCAVHPGFLAGIVPVIDPEDSANRWYGCGVGVAVDGDRLVARYESDVAVLELPPRGVRVSWASASTSYQSDFHRLVDPRVDPMPSVGDEITQVGYGSSGALAVDEASLAERRFRVGEILAFCAYGRCTGEEGLQTSHGTGKGDSGGPAIWSADPTPSTWRRPPIGVASFKPPGSPGGSYASLLALGNYDWLISMATDDQGRFIPACDRTVHPQAFDVSARSDNDTDGDGALDGVDMCPDDWGPCVVDRDADGVGDDCDTCIDVPNPGPEQLADYDRDGVPDACDNCLRVWNPLQEDGDVDLSCDIDGAGDHCAHFAPDGLGDACDNCDEVPNPLQENCNVDAEREKEVAELGDVCDPVPCGETTLWSRDVPPPPGEWRRTAMDEVRIDGLRVPEVAEPGYQAWTGTRFCRCTGALADSPANRDGCLRVRLDDTGGCTIADIGAYRDEPESATWRHATVDYVPPVPGGPGPRVRYPGSRTEVLSAYDPPGGGAPLDALGHWNQDFDMGRWAAPPIEDIFAFGPGDIMRGVFWTHTPGDVSGPGGADRVFDAPTRDLASHYWSGPVSGPIDLPAPFPCFNWIGPFIGTSPFCPACSASFPTPWLGVPGLPRSGGECGPLRIPEPPMLRVPDGMIDPAPAMGGDPWEVFGGIAGRWLPASEPDAWLPELGPRYAALAPGGLSIERVLVLREDGLVGEALDPCQGPNGCPPTPCDNPNGCDPLPLPCNDPNGCVGLATFSTAVAGPEASFAPSVAVFSARRQLVWVIAEDGTGGVRIVDLRSSSSRHAQITGPVELGRVLAATYSPSADALLILDEVTVDVSRGGRDVGGRLGGPRRARLLRIDALGGEFEVLGQWPRVARTDSFAMATDPGGSLWVVTSGERSGRHVVVRLEVGPRRARLVGVRFGSGVLRSGVARANRRGISFVVGDRGGRQELLGYEGRELRPAHVRDVARCF